MNSKNTAFKNEKVSVHVTGTLLDEIKQALKNIKGWGSVEIFIQKGKVTQITERNIKKTDHDIEQGSARL